MWTVICRGDDDVMTRVRIALGRQLSNFFFGQHVILHHSTEVTHPSQGFSALPRPLALAEHSTGRTVHLPVDSKATPRPHLVNVDQGAPSLPLCRGSQICS